MGQSRWVGACALAGACFLVGHLIAQEPAAGDPFGSAGGQAQGDASDDPFGPGPSEAQPGGSDAADPFADPSAQTTGDRASEHASGPGDRGTEREPASEPDAQQRIEAALNQRLKTPLDYPETSLNSIMQMLAEEYEIPILFDTAALDAIAQSPETEVTAAYSGITLRSALKLLLGQCEDLAYVIDNEVLLITTEDEAQARLLTLVYQINDLLPRRGGDGGRAEGNAASDPPIVDVITRCVEHDSWALNGTGEGEICVLEPGVMVISQTQSVHNEVTRLLAEIRRVKRAIEDCPTGGL